MPSATEWRIYIDGVEQVIAAPTVTIGKRPGCDLHLDDPAISRDHCRLSLQARDVLVEDLGSTNGVYCNGSRQQRFRLQRTTDVFFVGPYRLRVDAVEGDADPFVDADGLQLLFELHRRFLETVDGPALADERLTLTALELFLQSEHTALPLWCSRRRLRQRLQDEIIGLGPLQRHFDDPEISEIMVNGSTQLYIVRRGKLEAVPERFLNDASVLHCIQRLIMPVGRSLDTRTPMVDARLPGRGRINAIIPPLSLVGPCLTIRKGGAARFAMQHLIDNGALTGQAAAFLQLAVERRCNLLIAGGTDTGKTTLLNLLSADIAQHERIITIEDTAELALKQPHVVSLEARPSNAEGEGGVGIRELVRNALRMRPDRLIIGECRGGEALDMLQAMNTGHDGCMTTLHANSARDSLARLETLCLLSGVELPIRAVREQIAGAVDLIVTLIRLSDGRRVVGGISEVGRMEELTITLQDLYMRNPRGMLVPTGIVPGFLEGEDDIGVYFNT